VRRAGAIALALIAVSACSLATKWKDLTGQDRTQEQAQTDLRICRDKVGWTDDKARSASSEAVEAFWQAAQSCMTERGWKLLEDDNYGRTNS
jgi:hypothetical protein